MTPPIKYLPYKHEDMGSNPHDTHKKSDMVVHSCNPSDKEAEAEFPK